MNRRKSFRRAAGLLACCTGSAVLLVQALPVHGDDWPQWLGPQRDGVWRETGIVEGLPAAGLRFRWRTEIGAGYAGPAVAEGRVFVLDRLLPPGTTNVAHAPEQGGIPGTERLLCLDEADGRLLWKHEYPVTYTVSYAAGPRATPTVDGDRVYALGAEGHLHCLAAADGRIIWSRELTKDFAIKTPLWGFAGHPLIDGGKLICLVGGPGSVAVAFDKHTGRELWRALDARQPGYAPPMVYTFGGRRQLILWHAEAVSGLDPETGRVFWTHPLPAREGLSVTTPRQIEGDRLFLTTFYNGSLMLRVRDDQPEVLWQSKKISEKETDALHSIMATPVIDAGHIYGVCSYGEFRCLRADTGERVWETFAPTTGKSVRWGTAFTVKHADWWFLFNEQGDLIIARLSPEGYEETSRARLIEPDNDDPRRPVVWSHPAFANRSVYARNNHELVCVSLAKD